MEIDLAQFVALVANIGVIAGLLFLAMEIRQNNKFLAAQARYSLRQYRADIADSLMLPHVLDATHKWARNEEITPEEKSTGLMVALKIVELWEWQYGEHAAGMLRKEELPVGAWRLWFFDMGPFPVPVREIYNMRKSVLNTEFVEFFEQNVVALPPEQNAD